VPIHGNKPVGRTFSNLVASVYAKDVANVEKFMPRDFISKDGYGITDKCRKYLTGLIQGEDYPKYENGLPVYVTLKNSANCTQLTATSAFSS